MIYAPWCASAHSSRGPAPGPRPSGVREVRLHCRGPPAAVAALGRSLARRDVDVSPSHRCPPQHLKHLSASGSLAVAGATGRDAGQASTHSSGSSTSSVCDVPGPRPARSRGMTAGTCRSASGLRCPHPAPHRLVRTPFAGHYGDSLLTDGRHRPGRTTKEAEE